jgi:hypothetical protein
MVLTAIVGADGASRQGPSVILHCDFLVLYGFSI